MKKWTDTVSKGSLGVGLMLLLVLLFSAHVLAQTCVQPPPGVIAWWPLDETSGTTAEDIAGNNPGIHVNGPVPASGQVDGALRFDGGNDYVGSGDSDLWAFGLNDFTIELWANFDTPGGGSIGHPGDIFIGSDDGPGTQNKWFFALGGGVLNFHINGPGTGSFFLVQAPFSPTVGQWYHLAVTRNGTNYTIFVDGSPIGSETNTVAIPNASAPLTIGQAEELGFMNGFLDEVTIYNRALTQQELAAIATAASAGKCKELTIAIRTVPAVKLGEPSSFQFKARFGMPPFSWSTVNGTLPPGLALNFDGSLSGIPTQAGTFSFTVKVTDSNSDTAGKSFTQDVVLIPPPPDIRIRKAGTVSVPGRTQDYFAVVENSGSVAATDVKVTEFLEPWFTFISADPIPLAIRQAPDPFPGGPTGNEYDALIDWNISSLQPGEARILTYRVKLDDQFPIGETVTGGICLNVDATEKCLNKLFVCFGLIPVAGCSSPADCLRKVYVCEALYYACLFIDARVPCGTAPNNANGAIDPNEKVVITKKFIQPDQLLVYPIHFENIGTIEAQDVFVTDVLDSNLDTSTLSLLTATGASFDGATRTVRWDLLGRNLQPQETGNVLLAIRPLPGLPSGTEIRNKATIQFEVFDLLDTNEVVNIIDSTKPTCTINPLPAQTSTLDFPISWSGTDTVGEIESYSVLVSVDGGNFTPFLEKTSDTSATFTGELGKTYAFLCVATDTAGNIEVQNPVAETTTTLVLPAGLTLKKGTLLLDPDPDEDKLTLQGTFAGSATSINPPAEGVKIILIDADGQIVSLDFPAGALWKTNQGLRWTFRDPTTGKTVTLQFNTKTGTFALRVNVRKVNLNDPDPGAITTSVMIGDNIFQNVREWRSTAKGKKLVTP